MYVVYSMAATTAPVIGTVYMEQTVGNAVTRGLHCKHVVNCGHVLVCYCIDERELCVIGCLLEGNTREFQPSIVVIRILGNSSPNFH